MIKTVWKRIKGWFKFHKATSISAGVAALILLGIIIVLNFLMKPDFGVPAKTLSFVKDAVAKQQKIEQQLNAAYQAGKYTFTDPLVVQDPYQTAPLTALLIFDTPENSQISIQVPGKSSQSVVDFTFPGFQQHHEIPVYGLYAATLNHVIVSMKTQNGVSARTQIDLQTEALPDYIPSFTINKVDPGKYSPGLNFALLLERKPVFDIDGNVRWYSTQKSWAVLTPLKNGRYLFTYMTNAEEGDVMMEQDLLGKIYAIYNVRDGIHHDIYELPNGNLLITSGDIYSSTVDDYLIEVDPKSGHIVRSFDLKDTLDQNRPHELGLIAKDWLHINSILYDPVDKTIIISAKAQSAVIKMTYPGMQIKWILGPHDNWSAKYQPYLLTPVGNNFEWPWSQHHVTLYGPHVPGDDSIDILMFDNALYRSFVSTSTYLSSDWYSRVVHYRINEKAMTIEQIWEYGQERGPELFSSVHGSAYLLSNGDVLGTWGNIYKDAKGNPTVTLTNKGTLKTKIIEVDPANNAVVFECTTPVETYRTLRAGLYDGYSEKNAYLSTPLIDTTGNDLTDRSVLAWREVRRNVINPGLAWFKTIGL